MTTVFIEAFDVLLFRGNKLFGDPGSFGESLVPPWPSVAAGALRSRMLADAGVDPSAFARGEVSHPELGTPDTPGPLTVAAFHLARRHADGQVEPLFALPADLVVSEEMGGGLSVRPLTPLPLGQIRRERIWSNEVRPQGSGQDRPETKESGVRVGIACSYPLSLFPVLAENTRSKPVSGYWLTASGWRKYLQGETPAADDFIPSGQLWTLDPRVGVGLDAATRCAAEGRLFSVQAVAMRPDVGFLVAVAGAKPPMEGTLRLGGDGRAAAVSAATLEWPEPDYDAIATSHRCRLVLTTPGIFETGWLPTGVTKSADGGFRFELHGVRGKLVCAAVPRAEVVSGWDLAKWQPKAAQRAAPTGSVYWLELEDGVTADALLKLVERGLWTDEQYDAELRRAEGFNRLALAIWK